MMVRRFLCVALLAGLMNVGCSKEEDEASLPLNFHVIEEGKAYRSAQPRPDELRHAIDEYKIRTVVNLRGPNEGKDWYDQEVAVCEDEKIAHTDIRLSSKSLPSVEELEQLVNTLEHAERPILMHCQGGADRSGLAAAMYRIVVEGKSKEDALAELSEKYSHFREMKPCMSTFIDIYQPGAEWLEEYEANRDETECK